MHFSVLYYGVITVCFRMLPHAYHVNALTVVFVIQGGLLAHADSGPHNLYAFRNGEMLWYRASDATWINMNSGVPETGTVLGVSVSQDTFWLTKPDEIVYRDDIGKSINCWGSYDVSWGSRAFFKHKIQFVQRDIVIIVGGVFYTSILHYST